MKKITMLSVMAVIAIMVLAATAIPMMKDADTDMNSGYIPRTVVIDNNTDPFINKLGAVFDNVSGEYSYNFRGDLTYAVSATVGELFPNVPESIKNIQMDILSTLGSDGKPTVTYNVDSDLIDWTLFDYYVIYDENDKFYDITFTYDGVTSSLRDLYDPYEDCFVFVIFAIPVVISLVDAILIGGAAAGMVIAAYLANDQRNGGHVGTDILDGFTNYCKVMGIVLTATFNPNNYENIKWKGVVDGIMYSEEDGILISVSVGNTTYMAYDLSYDITKLDKYSYYYTILHKNTKGDRTSAFIIPKEITSSQAQSIMKMTNNNGGMHSVWTYQSSYASSIASVLGAPPVLDPPHGSPGYFQHYHTKGRTTEAHAFFGTPT
ncbi:MAG: hypothetical protein FWG96_07265 [Methanomassiliicoccaceae archaeon]|nr:hypothetical protein [Methanomassiliicoccaceae archaeon]